MVRLPDSEKKFENMLTRFDMTDGRLGRGNGPFNGPSIALEVSRRCTI